MSSLLKVTDKSNYEVFETNPTKEIIAQGRTPTLEGSKEWNNSLNIDIKKLEYDRLPQRESYNIDKIYDKYGPQLGYGKETVTTMKERLNDSSISNRIEPDILDPFKNNPYTKPLDSF